MRKTKRTVLTIATVMAFVLIGGWAFAHGPWGERGRGYPKSGYGFYPDLLPEQREKLQAQQQKFYEDTSELRRELYQKRLELQGLWIDPKADPEKIKAKQREMFELQRQLREKALDHRLAIRELLPQEEFGQGPWGYGYGMHHGPGHGGEHMSGHGFGPRKGYGGGHCW